MSGPSNWRPGVRWLRDPTDPALPLALAVMVVLAGCGSSASSAPRVRALRHPRAPHSLARSRRRDSRKRAGASSGTPCPATSRCSRARPRRRRRPPVQHRPTWSSTAATRWRSRHSCNPGSQQAGFKNQGASGPLENGGYVLDMTGPVAGCEVRITVEPTGGDGHDHDPLRGRLPARLRTRRSPRVRRVSQRWLVHPRNASASPCVYPAANRSRFRFDLAWGRRDRAVSSSARHRSARTRRGAIRHPVRAQPDAGVARSVTPARIASIPKV